MPDITSERGLLMGFFRRWRKYRMLSQLSRKLDSIATTAEALLSNTKDQALQQLLLRIENDEDCAAVIRRHHADSKALSEIFWELKGAGAGQWNEGLYIPCVALAEPWALDYLLRRRANSGRIGEEEAFRIVTFYQDKKPLSWLSA